MDLRTNTSLGIALVLCFVGVACAAPAIPDDPTLDDSSGAATANKKTPPTQTTKPTAPSESDPSTTTSTPPPATTTPPATTAAPTFNTATCTAQAPDACFDCCNQGSGGALAPADNVYGQCACGTGGQCAAVCDANLCTGGVATAACSSCVQATCVPAEAAACTSAACKAGLACAKLCN
jgi:hypothetical protein